MSTAIELTHPEIGVLEVYINQIRHEDTGRYIKGPTTYYINDVQVTKEMAHTWYARYRALHGFDPIDGNSEGVDYDW